MAVRDPGGCRRQSGPQKSNAVPELPAAPAVQPVMRRWPHPVAVHPAPEGLAAELHYISCALSQQTRQLDEIRCLLKRLANSAGSVNCICGKMSICQILMTHQVTGHWLVYI